MSIRRTTLGVLTILALTASFAHAATDAERCVAIKLKAMGKKASADIICHAKAVKQETFADPDCLARSQAKFDHVFEMADANGGCPRPGDASSMQGYVDDFVTNVTAREAVTPCLGSGSSCGIGFGFCCPGLSCQPFDPMLPFFYYCR
jgi:hypothetical protein